MHLHSAADFIDIVLPEHCPSTSGDTCLKHADCVVQSNTELPSGVRCARQIQA